jgi:hypothetical protein
MIIGISGKIGSGKDTVGKIIQALTAQNITEGEVIEIVNNKLLNFNSNWQIKKFAGKLKQIVSILTGISVEDLEKQEVKDRILGEEWRRFFFKEINGIRIPASFYGIYTSEKEAYKIGIDHLNLVTEVLTIRQLLQEVGTEAMRNIIHPNVWVNALFSDYKKPAQIAIEETGGYTNSNKPFDFPNWIITDVRFPNELKTIEDRKGITIRIRKPTRDLFGNKIDAQLPLTILTEHESEKALDNAEFDYTINNDGTIEELIEKVKEILIAEKII